MDLPPPQEFYRPVTDELCQGDVFATVPLVRLRGAPLALTRADFSPTRSGYEADTGFDPAAASPAQRRDRSILATCDYTHAVLLTHDCEIDKPNAKDLSLAIVRPVDRAWTPEELRRIRNGDKLAMFYLEQDGDWQPCYVDFRRLVTVGPDLLKSLSRVRRLGEVPRDAMLYQLFQFFTRRKIDAGGTTPVPDPPAAPASPAPGG